MFFEKYIFFKKGLDKRRQSDYNGTHEGNGVLEQYSSEAPFFFSHDPQNGTRNNFLLPIRVTDQGGFDNEHRLGLFRKPCI